MYKKEVFVVFVWVIIVRMYDACTIELFIYITTSNHIHTQSHWVLDHRRNEIKKKNNVQHNIKIKSKKYIKK